VLAAGGSNFRRLLSGETDGSPRSRENGGAGDAGGASPASSASRGRLPAGAGDRSLTKPFAVREIRPKAMSFTANAVSRQNSANEFIF